MLKCQYYSLPKIIAPLKKYVEDKVKKEKHPTIYTTMIQLSPSAPFSGTILKVQLK